MVKKIQRILYPIPFWRDRSYTTDKKKKSGSPDITKRQTVEGKDGPCVWLNKKEKENKKKENKDKNIFLIIVWIDKK